MMDVLEHTQHMMTPPEHKQVMMNTVGTQSTASASDRGSISIGSWQHQHQTWQLQLMNAPGTHTQQMLNALETHTTDDEHPWNTHKIMNAPGTHSTDDKRVWNTQPMNACGTQFSFANIGYSLFTTILQLSLSTTVLLPGYTHYLLQYCNQDTLICYNNTTSLHLLSVTIHHQATFIIYYRNTTGLHLTATVLLPGYTYYLLQ